jgi:WhiB family transcriptional regulator, redox-sensing transcriptional regulator
MKQLDTSQAKCTEETSELFFSTNWADIEEAKSLCRVCPIMEDCLEEASRNNIEFGVWGGATFEERKLFKRQPRKKLEHIYITMGEKIDDHNTRGYE